MSEELKLRIDTPADLKGLEQYVNQLTKAIGQQKKLGQSTVELEAKLKGLTDAWSQSYSKLSNPTASQDAMNDVVQGAEHLLAVVTKIRQVQAAPLTNTGSGLAVNPKSFFAVPPPLPPPGATPAATASAATAGMPSFSRGFGQISTAVNSFNMVGGGALGVLAAMSSMLYLGTRAVRAFWDAIKEAIMAAARYEKSIVAVRSALGQQGAATTENVNHFRVLAQQMSGESGIASDVLLNHLAQLTQVGMNPAHAERYGHALTHLSALMGGDVKSAASAMESALTGDFHAFQKMGIVVNEFASTTDRMNEALLQLASRGAYESAAQLDTLHGRVDELKTSLLGLAQTQLNASETFAAFKIVLRGFSWVAQVVAEGQTRLEVKFREHFPTLDALMHKFVRLNEFISGLRGRSAEAALSQAELAASEDSLKKSMELTTWEVQRQTQALQDNLHVMQERAAQEDKEADANMALELATLHADRSKSALQKQKEEASIRNRYSNAKFAREQARDQEKIDAISATRGDEQARMDAANQAATLAFARVESIKLLADSPTKARDLAEAQNAANNAAKEALRLRTELLPQIHQQTVQINDLQRKMAGDARVRGVVAATTNIEQGAAIRDSTLRALDHTSQQRLIKEETDTQISRDLLVKKIGDRIRLQGPRKGAQTRAETLQLQEMERKIKAIETYKEFQDLQTKFDEAVLGSDAPTQATILSTITQKQNIYRAAFEQLNRDRRAARLPQLRFELPTAGSPRDQRLTPGVAGAETPVTPAGAQGIQIPTALGLPPLTVQLPGAATNLNAAAVDLNAAARQLMETATAISTGLRSVRNQLP